MQRTSDAENKDSSSGNSKEKNPNFCMEKVVKGKETKKFHGLFKGILLCLRESPIMFIYFQNSLNSLITARVEVCGEIKT